MDYDDSMTAWQERYEAEHEYYLEKAMEEAYLREADEAFEAQQRDPLRAVCLWHDDPAGCLEPSVYDREDEIPF